MVFLLSAAFVPREIHFAGSLAFLIFSGVSQPSMYRTIGRLFLPMFAFTLIGLLISLASGVVDRDLMKGMFYCLRPVVYAGVGLVLTRRVATTGTFFMTILVGALFLAGLYVSKSIVAPDDVFLDRNTLRGTVGTGYILIPIGVIVAFYNLRQHTILAVAMIVLGLMSILISDSRTSSILGVMLFACVAGLVPRRALTILPPLIVAVLFVLTTPFLTHFVDAGTLGELVYTLPRSLAEILPVERLTFEDVNNGWRGFETFLAFTFVDDHGLSGWVAGTGLHSSVPAYAGIFLSSDELDGIPIFHNGYSFIFVRAGFLGLILFVIQVWMLSASMRLLMTSKDPEVRRMGRFVVGLIAAGAALTPIVSGLLNPGELSATLMVLIGIGIGAGETLKNMAREGVRT